MRQTTLILPATLTMALVVALAVPLRSAHAATGPSDEAPPPAEAPYPNAPEEGFAQKPAPRIAEPGVSTAVDTPAPTTGTGAITDAIVDDPVSSDVSNQPLPPPRQSKRVASTDPNAPAPLKKNADGSWDYGKDPSNGGEYRYKAVSVKEINYNEHDKPPGSDHSSFFRFAYFGAPDITNPDNNRTFRDIYKAQNYPSALMDYEWKITRKIGDVGIKFGSGVFFSQGTGEWANPDRAQSDTQQPLERFSFFMLPNTVSGIYRFRYKDRQVLVPYVEAGPGVFTFMETRDDSKGPKFGAAPVVFAAAGLNVLVDGIDRDAMKNLRQDYAINHLYLNAELREIKGFGKFDFSSRVICGGLGAEF